MPPTPPHPRPTPRRRAVAGGFTLIELLVVIGVILVLGSLLFVGGRALMGSVKERQTRARLEVLRSVLAEYLNDPANAERFGRTGMEFGPAGGVQRYPEQAGVIFETVNPVLVTEAGPAVTPAVLRTGLMMRKLTGNPRAAALLNEQPAEAKLNLRGPVASAFPTISGIPGTTSPYGTILRDGWGNPVLFVPGGFTGSRDDGGLAGLYSEAQKVRWTLGNEDEPNLTALTPGFETVRRDVNDTDGDKDFDEPSEPVPFRPTDLRAFWASAGPDGNFATHDDNVYSFED